MNKLILIRHGQSEWNKKNLFTGWVDIPLSEEGVQEALKGGKEIRGLPVDLIFTSTLIRGIMTAMLVMTGHASGKVPVLLHPGEGRMEEWGKCYSKTAEQSLIPVVCAWELNERMYGELQGQNKQEVKERFGEKQFKLWRRSYAASPPHGESLKMTAERTLPYFDNTVLPELKAGKNIVIAAHGNSLRSIVMELDRLSEEEVVSLEIPTGKPLFYEYRDGEIRKI